MEGCDLNLPLNDQVSYRLWSRELRGDKIATRECYIAMLEMDDHLQTMNIEEQRTMIEPLERLEEIPLDGSRLNRTTWISTLANPVVRLALFSQSESGCIRLDP